MLVKFTILALVGIATTLADECRFAKDFDPTKFTEDSDYLNSYL